MNALRPRIRSFAARPWRALTAAALVVSSVALISPPHARAVGEPPYQIDLKVLVLDDNASPWVDAIQSQMQVEGVPFTTINLTGTTNFTASTLASGSHAFYQAVVLPSYNASGLSGAERNTLDAFESKFSIREVDAFDYPAAAIGMNTPPGTPGDFTGTATMTPEGAAAGFGYLDGQLPFSSAGSYTYFSTPLTSLPVGSTFTTYMTATGGGVTNATILGVYASGGTEQLIITSGLNFNQLQFKYLGHGIITWMTRGIHFGYNRNNFTFHVDDAFNEDALWSETANCTPGEDCAGTATTIRMQPADVDYAVTWMQQNRYKLTLGFNAVYAYLAGQPDPLADEFKLKATEFNWFNHGYEHVYQGCAQPGTQTFPWVCQTSNGQLVWVTQEAIYNEINQNIVAGKALGLPFDAAEYLSGEHSGLAFTSVTTPPVTGQNQPDNPNFALALTQAGILAIGSDASRESTSRTVGSANTVPRHPTILYYNAATQAQAIDEYNTIYPSTPVDPVTGFTGTMIPNDAGYDLGFILSNDPRPFYAHTTNLTGERLAYYLLDAILGTYRGVFADSADVVNLTLTQAATMLTRQQQWEIFPNSTTTNTYLGDANSVVGYVQNGVVSISNSTGHPVPFTAPTGSTTSAASLQPYGGEFSAWLAAGNQTVNVPSSTLTVTGGLFYPLQLGSPMSISVAGVPSPVVSVAGNVPAGLTMTPTATGANITGTPNAGTEGVYPLVVTSLGVGYPRVEQVTVVVARAPAFANFADPVAVAGRTFAFLIATSGGVPVPAITSSALPAGVTLTDNGNGTATLGGTPAASTGNQQFSITAAATSVVNGQTAYSVNKTFTLTVNTVPAFTSTDKVSPVATEAFAFTVTTTGVPTPAITKSGTLPSGVTFTDDHDGTATIAGTPVVGDIGKSFPITLTATNSSDVAHQAFTLNVMADASLRSITPARLADTRMGPDYLTVDGKFQGIDQRPIGSTLQLTVAGRGGVPTDAIAVALNVTSAEAVGGGYVTVYPCGAARPTASNVNYTAGSVVPNAVIAKIGDSGSVCLFTSNATQLIVDVNGYFPAASTFQPMNPARLLETRAGLPTVDHQNEGEGMRGQTTVTTLHVVDRAGVPADAAAVVLNVTATEGQGLGYVTVYPCGQVPTASNINYAAGSTVANMVIAKVDPSGNVCLFNNVATHLVVDVNGYFPNDGSYLAMDPARLLETRPGLPTIDNTFNGGGMPPNGTITELVVAGRPGVPANAKTVVLNVTVTEATLPGFITVYPCGIDTPLASNLNYTAGATVAIAVIAQVPSSGKVCLFNSAGTHLIADVNGYLLN